MFLKLPKKQQMLLKRNLAMPHSLHMLLRLLRNMLMTLVIAMRIFILGILTPKILLNPLRIQKMKEIILKVSFFEALRTLIYERNDKSLRSIAKEYGIPESTLRYRYHKILDGVQKGECPFGQTNRKNLTSAEEEIICNMIYDLSKRGHYTTKTLVINIMLEVMIADRFPKACI